MTDSYLSHKTQQ